MKKTTKIEKKNLKREKKIRERPYSTTLSHFDYVRKIDWIALS